MAALYFLGGLVIGSCFGMVLTALLSANHNQNETE